MPFEHPTPLFIRKIPGNIFQPFITALRSTIFINTGHGRKIRTPPAIPLAKMIQQKRDASPFTVSICLVPMAFPSRTAPALAIPKQTTVPS